MLDMGTRRELTAAERADAKRLRAAWNSVKDQLKLSQEQVAFQCGWKTQGAFSQYVNGTIPLNLEALLRITSVLKVDPRTISPRLSKKLGPTLSVPLDSGTDLILANVPIVGNTQAGPDKAWEEMGYPVGFGDDYLDAPSKDPRAYGLRVRGGSMAPRMREGEVILVEPSGKAEPGDEVVVRLENGTVMVKVLVSMREGEVTLDSIAEGFDRLVIPTSQISFMHAVAGVFRSSRVRKRAPPSA